MSSNQLFVPLSRRQQAYLSFLALVLFQGFHELEHIVQIIQRFVLGIANGAGIVGSYFDAVPVHFLYNTVFLALIVVPYVQLGMQRSGARQTYGLAWYLLTFAIVFQSWHELEHVVKLVQYFELNHNNAVGGILAVGPGAILPLFNNVWLHFWYNTIPYVPIVIAYFLLGMHRELATDLAKVRANQAAS